jgi:hypothetical protein|tara:strand:- start:31 stop:543 length:513 start_codon:yes stop_codon:yes gene_type:complete
LTTKIYSLSDDLATLKHNLKGAFRSSKDELDMHLDTINQNTNEIQTNYESIAELDVKIEKLADKIDELQLLLNPSNYNFSEVNLSKIEQEFFLNLYTVEDRISITNFARKCGLTIEMCESMLQRMISKGIPIVKQLVDNMVFISLEYTFKDLQARKNFLKIDVSVCKNLN